MDHADRHAERAMKSDLGIMVPVVAIASTVLVPPVTGLPLIPEFIGATMPADVNIDLFEESFPPGAGDLNDDGIEDLVIGNRYDGAISLPLYPDLTDRDQDRVIQVLERQLEIHRGAAAQVTP